MDDNLDNEELQNMARNLGGATEMTSEALIELAKTAGSISGVDIDVNTDKLEKSLMDRIVAGGEAIVDALAPLGSSTLKFYQSVGAGNTSFTSLNTVMRGASQSLGKIPVVGEALSKTMDALGPVANELLKELDLQRGTFHNLSKYGALTGEGMSNMQQEWLKSQMAIANFSGAIAKNSQTLALMRGTTADGVSTFSDMMGDMLQGSDDRLRLLGMTQTDISDVTSSYLKIQSRMGLAQKKSTAELEAGAKDYAIQLTALSKFSGKNIEELEKQIEAATADDRWQALNSMVDQRTQVAMDQRNKMMEALGPEVAKGYRDAQAGANTEAARQFRMTFGTAALDLNNSNEAAFSAMQSYAKSQLETNQTLTLLSTEQQKTLMPFNVQLAVVNRRAEDLADAMSQTAAAAAGADKQTKNVIDTEKAGEKIANNYHAELTKAVPVMADVTRMAMGGLNKFGDEIVNLGNTFEKLTGIHIPSPEEGYEATKGAIQAGMDKITNALTPGVTGNKAAQEAMSFFQGKGWTKEQAAGLVGNLMQEGGFRESIISGRERGDSGKAVGIAQWHADRQQNFKQLYGKELAGSTLQEQLEFINYELTKGTEKRAGERIKQTTTAQEAAATVDQYYERSAGKQRQERMSYAQAMLNAGDDQALTHTAVKSPTPTTSPGAPEAERKELVTNQPGQPEKRSSGGMVDTSRQETNQAALTHPTVPVTQTEKNIAEMRENYDKAPPPQTPDQATQSVVKATGYTETTLSAKQESDLTNIKRQLPQSFSQDQINQDLAVKAPPLDLASLGVTPMTTGSTPVMTDTTLSGMVNSLTSSMGLSNIFTALGSTTPALTGLASMNGLGDNALSQLDSLTGNTTSDLAAPKLPESSNTPEPPAPTSGTATPNDSSGGQDPNVAIAQMNGILNDIVSKLDTLNTVGQRQVVATNDLGKAVQSP